MQPARPDCEVGIVIFGTIIVVLIIVGIAAYSDYAIKLRIARAEQEEAARKKAVELALIAMYEENIRNNANQNRR